MAALGAAGCTSSGGAPYTGPRLQAIFNGNAGQAVTVVAGRPYVFPLRPLCTTSTALRVTSVRPADPTGGIAVVDWGIRLRYPGDPYTPADNGGAAPGRVSQFRGFRPQTPVTVSCTDPGARLDEFDVSLSVRSARGTMSGVWAYYASGHRTFVQFATALCTTESCPAAPLPK